MAQVPNLIGGVVGDLISTLGAPLSNTVGAVAASLLSDYQSRKEAEALGILKEIVRGDRSLADGLVQDHLFAIWLRYRHAAVTGVAHEKLRIMAQVLDGQLETKQLSPEEFSQFASVLEGLRLDEIAFLVTLYELEQEAPTKEKERGDRGKWVEEQLKARLIPSVAPDKDALEAIEAAVLRTGLLIAADTIALSGSSRRTSPLMAELVRLAKLSRTSG